MAVKKTKKQETFADLHHMYEVVCEHISSREYSWCSEESKNAIMRRYKELEQEIYDRLYGFNPFENLANPSVAAKGSFDNSGYITMNKGKPTKTKAGP